MSNKVNKALVMAGSRGSRLGMGTKSHILYKNKILLEYVLEPIFLAGIKDILVFLPNKDDDDKIPRKSLERLDYLKNKYKDIMWVQYPTELGLGFRGAIDLVINHFGKEPFYLLCGHSPQSYVHLKKMAKIFTDGSVVLSGYKYRYESCVSIATTNAYKAIGFENIEKNKPEDFIVEGDKHITQMPYIIDRTFYEETIKKDLFKNKIEFYPKIYLENEKTCYVIENPIKISEVDYKKDFQKLLDSIDTLIDSAYKL